jgi:hypothetical protein
MQSPPAPALWCAPPFPVRSPVLANTRMRMMMQQSEPPPHPHTQQRKHSKTCMHTPTRTTHTRTLWVCAGAVFPTRGARLQGTVPCAGPLPATPLTAHTHTHTHTHTLREDDARSSDAYRRVEQDAWRCTHRHRHDRHNAHTHTHTHTRKHTHTGRTSEGVVAGHRRAHVHAVARSTCKPVCARGGGHVAAHSSASEGKPCGLTSMAHTQT